MRRRLGVLLLLAAAGCGPEGPHGSHGEATAPEPVRVRPFGIPDPDVVLLVTGGTNGMLEVCNCAGPMAGGLSRRSGLVRSYRAAFGNVLLIDTGDAFWIEPTDLRNEFLLKGYGQVGYDAIVPGDQEWAAGPKPLSEMLAGHGLTCLSTSVTGEPVPVRPVVERPAGGGKLAVVADVRRSAFRFVPEKNLAGVSVADPDVVAERVAKLKADGFVVVAVAHMEPEELESLAALPVDLILRGHTTRSEPELLTVAGKPVVKVGGSETLGAVALKIEGDRIAAVEYRLETVNTDWPLDKRLLQTYQAYAHAAMRKAMDAERKEGLGYVSTASCGACHAPQYKAWKTSRHAHAYETLKKAKRTDNPNCLACHTSGFGTKEGFFTIEKTPELAGVNCQDCHRFNSREHRRKGFRFPPVNNNVCTTCHTPVTDPKFDFRRKLPKVRCPHGGA